MTKEKHDYFRAQRSAAQQAPSVTELLEGLRGLYMALRERHHGRMPDEVQAAYDMAATLLRKYPAQQAAQAVPAPSFDHFAGDHP